MAIDSTPFDNVYNALNVSAITSILDDRGYEAGKALFSGKELPEKFQNDKSILLYLNVPHNYSTYVRDYVFMASCRAASYDESLTIANTVINTINETTVSNDFFICSLGVTIEPKDNTDNYNTPVEIIYKLRSL